MRIALLEGLLREQIVRSSASALGAADGVELSDELQRSLRALGSLQ